MCGLAGFVEFPAGTGEVGLTRLGLAMADAIRRRGPDDHGVWVDADAGTCLAHRRLAIIDLSPAGHQPMVSACGRLVIAYNGEIFNHIELRRELGALGHTFRSQSDTEVILAAFIEWGVEQAVNRFIGMFAIALWDRSDRVLSLVRDRLGIKPLYWTRLASGTVIFGSELKALRRHPGWDGTVDRDALASYMRFGYVPTPRTIHRDVFKLEPGCILRFPAGGVPVRTTFWDAREKMLAGRTGRLELSPTEATDALEALLKDAVGRRMIADVPLGAFLSGGIDSSAVVALMQAQSSRPVKTFSIGFHEEGYDEAGQARAVAAHLGTDHCELYVDSAQAMAVIPEMPCLYDEPFADSSQIPTYLVSRLARGHVTVALSGDGGDELFAGYTRYGVADGFWRQLTRIPAPFRRLGRSAIRAVPPRWWDRAFQLVPAPVRPSHPGQKLHKLATALDVPRANEFYRSIVSHWQDPNALVIDGKELSTLIDDCQLDRECPDFVERMQHLDLVTYLPDDILTKVDRASMAVALEARVPLIDHRVVEFAMSLPLDLKIRNGQTKWLLRQVLYRYIPPSLVDRPKMGFGVPIGAWLRGPLKDWAAPLLDSTRLRQDGFFKEELIREKWDQHLTGKVDWQYLLWDVVMFQAWLDHIRSEQPT